VLVAALVAVSGRAFAQPSNAPWAEVDTAARTLTVYTAYGRRLARYADISIGSGGASAVHYRGDHTTPLGNYRIVHIRPSCSFDTFYLLDYPTAEHAEAATRSGRLTEKGREAILAAFEEGRAPPQDTALGGAIGIHGIGRGSLKVHKAYNWTDGCVALTNEQLHDFARYAAVGMRVIIR
jgi:murein L,D-transpeptidase YafK